MNEIFEFPDRAEFREWLHRNGTTSAGIWLIFGKKGGPVTITATEALEEALCYGWIDGHIQSIDDTKYRKYFARRTKNSKWSEKNKKLVEKLEEKGIMTDHGRETIMEAKKNGQWDAPKASDVSNEQIIALSKLLEEHEPAYTNFQAMSPSVKRTYARAYLDAKTDIGRSNRLSWMIDRLNKNLKPM